MKKYYLAALFLVFSFAVSARPSRLVVKPSVPASELYYWSLSGETLPYYTLATKISPEVDGTFRFNVDIRKPAVYYIRIGGESVKMYITPNGVDSLTVRNGSYVFGGSNKACNTILAELDKSDKYCQSYRSVEVHELDKITNLENFKKLIEARKTKDLDLLLTDVLPDDFVSQQKKDIDIRYRLLLARKICYKLGEPRTCDWLGELKKELNAISQGENATMSYDHSALLEVAVCGCAFVLDKKDPQSVRDTFNSFLFNNYCDILKGASLEYALATLIYEDFFQKNYSKDIPELFYRFKKLFPRSRFIATLKPGVIETAAMYNVTSHKSVLFLENTDVNTFEDLTRLFTGKVVYIDLWATWCGPCVEMFSYLETLKHTLKKMDVTYLYISIDRDENDMKWRKMANHYKLEGYNLRANPQLLDVILHQFGDKNGVLSIPRNIIFDREGKIVVNNAASPDEPRKVMEQLKKSMK